MNPLKPDGPKTQAPDPAENRNDSLEAIHKQFRLQLGKIEANALTTHLATVILQRSLNEGCSDVHFDPQGDLIHVRFRIDGQLKDRLTFSKKEFPITSLLRVMAGFDPQAATAYTPEDGAFEITMDKRLVRFRASSFPTIFGDKLVVRLLDMGLDTLNIEALGIDPAELETLKSLVSSPSGIFFSCGVTGGGKTTTLCSILKYLNSPAINIMTLEDPVEYRIPGLIQSNISAKAGFSFADGLRSILRQDPNIIMVGEVRDFETAEISIRAALTGHFIFSTIHAINTTGAITRLIDIGVEPFLLGEALTGVLAQRLVRKICLDCAESIEPDPQTADLIVRDLAPKDATIAVGKMVAPGADYKKGKGCAACQGTGYKGRTGIFELLRLTKPLRELILKKSSPGELRAAALKAGLRTLAADGISKARSGITTLEEIQRVTVEM